MYNTVWYLKKIQDTYDRLVDMTQLMGVSSATTAEIGVGYHRT